MFTLGNKKIIDIKLGEHNVLQVFKDDKLIWPVNSINTNGYEYVDMGEAGIWATCNIGSENPDDYGLYFQWGDTEGWTEEQVKNGEKIFNEANYKFYDTTAGTGDTNRYIKYNKQKDSLIVLEPEDDVVHVLMGGDWRMPTEEEAQKLIDLCNYEKGPNGTRYCVLTLKTDPTKSIMFPACGQMQNNSLRYEGQYGYFWTSSVRSNSNSVNQAMKIRNYGSSPNLTYEYKYYGLPVRGFISPPES